MTQLLAIAAGGALGAVMRHGVNQAALIWLGLSFPWGTMLVNIAGSFAMGLLVASFAHVWDVSQTMRLFLTVGILGGFTTFSAFSLDSLLLLQKGQTLAAIFYIVGSVILSLAALALGMLLIRMLPA